MKREIVNQMGMEFEQWTHKSCTAAFGIGDDWATLFIIESENPGKGEATELLTEVQELYKKEGKTVYGSVALNPAMVRIYNKLNIKEYK